MILDLGEEICSLARMGQKKMISCYKLAGADLNTVNMSRQTALHAAVETGQFKVVQFLIEHHIDTARKDIFGRTAKDLAVLLNRKEILSLLERSEEKNV